MLSWRFARVLWSRVSNRTSYSLRRCLARLSVSISVSCQKTPQKIQSRNIFRVISFLYAQETNPSHVFNIVRSRVKIVTLRQSKICSLPCKFKVVTIIRRWSFLTWIPLYLTEINWIYFSKKLLFTVSFRRSTSLCNKGDKVARVSVT